MFALTNFNAPSHDQEGATAANIQWRVCAIVLLLFIVAATVSAIRKDVTQGFDEVAHASYIAYLQDFGGTWPAFEDMRMLDPSAFTSPVSILITPRPTICYWLASVPIWKGIPMQSSSIDCST